MSIFKPSMAVTRYNVSGIPMDGESDIMSAILEKFENNTIGEIQDGEEIAWGWTSMLVPFDPKFSDMSFMTGDYITVGMRIDVKKIPSAALKKEIFLAEKKYMEDNQITKIPRATRVMIKESIVKNMLDSAPVVPKDFNIIWNVAEKKLYLLSTSRVARNFLEDLIKETFNLDIRMLFPFTMGLASGVSEQDLSELAPTDFS